MSTRQLEQLRETLDSIVEDLCAREQAVDKEQAELLDRINQLDERQSHIKSLDEVLSSHQATEAQLAERLQTLVTLLEERSQTPPQWIKDQLAALEERLSNRLEQTLSQTRLAPTLEEITSELERTQSRSSQTLTEQLAASLQTAIAVQLAPLSDDLPERLQSAVASAVPTGPASLPLAMPELARELEKFETRSMASMAARMTAGLQTALANQFTSLSEDLSTKIAAAIAKGIPTTTSAPMATTTVASVDDEQIARLQKQIEQLEGKLKASAQSLKETEELLAEAIEHGNHNRAQDSKEPPAGQAPPHLIVRLTELEEECERLTAELKLARETGARSETPDANTEDELVAALRAEVNELRSLLQVKEKDTLLVDELREELAELRTRGQGESDHLAGTEDVELRERLERATCEIIDLRSENEELNHRISRLQISTAPHGPMPHLGQEGLSWEERKKLLLLQLNAELNDEDAEHSQAKRVEIEDVIKVTETELARRDREIAELRSLLEQQSDAREGMAVGAAAVAQLIESDELVQEEREKLRLLQKSWDEKLRQAEIDLSMERAKLARERLQLEEQKQQLEEALNAAMQNVDPNARIAAVDAKGRKWLSRLGLKDEK